MKTLLPLFLFGILLLSSCAKQEQINLSEESSCTNQTQARVEFVAVNEDGSDDFYYLVLQDAAGNDLSAVYSPRIPTNYKKIGTLVNVNYRSTSLIHKYIVCLAGHQIDPANPDFSEMPIVEVCDIAETKN
jgi:hypothetical protein